MGVAAHLKIDLADYDRRIRTFIPWYDEMLGAAAAALAVLRVRRPAILDLGIGTGALAARCLRARPGATLVGIDADPDMLPAAERRLRAARARLTLVAGDFERLPLVRADAIVASLSLHHVRTRARKRRLYARAFDALPRGGLLVNADCAPAANAAVAAAQHAAWRAHVERSYDRRAVSRYFSAWAHEDVYMPLPIEVACLSEAGFRVEVLWRRGPFAVIVGQRA